MNKTILNLILYSVIVMHFSQLQTFGAEGAYIGGQLGIAFLDDSELSDQFESVDLEFDPDIAVGGILGYDYGLLRFEGEVIYRTNDLDSIDNMKVSGDSSSLGFLVNIYRKIETDTPFSLYFGGGIGFADLDLEIDGSDFDDDDRVLAYQFGAGIGFSMSDVVTIDLGYRYFATEEADWEFEELDSDHSSHDFLLGIRYIFH